MAGRPEHVISQYRRLANQYDKERTRTLFERAWLDDFLNLCGTAPRIGDLGCGAAEPIAAYLIDNGAHLSGFDTSPEMIELCRTRYPGHDWKVADMRSLERRDRFDGLVAWDSFFHLTKNEQRGMFQVFSRLTKPNAGLLFTSGHQDGEAIGNLCGEPLYHASLSADEYMERLDRQGFDVIRHKKEDPACGFHTVWLARKRTL